MHLVGFYYKNHGFMLHVSESRMQAAFANVEGLHFAHRWFKVFELS